jgi:hypothetical protein
VRRAVSADQVGHGFRLGEIEAPVQERRCEPPGAGFALRAQRAEHRGRSEPATVAHSSTIFARTNATRNSARPPRRAAPTPRSIATAQPGSVWLAARKRRALNTASAHGTRRGR